MNPDKTDHVLAGDVGGTKTRLALFQAGTRRPRLKALATYASPEASCLETLIEAFMKACPMPLSGACFGIAGPVISGRCRATNLPWIVSERQIRRRFNWRHVYLLNDLAATAWGVPLLDHRELHPLNRARLRKGHNLALVAPGTGLGQALMVYGENGYRPVPSEGGHVDFGPNNREEAALWAYLHQRYGHVSAERVVSGSGLVNIYTWLKDSGKYKEPAWLSKRIQGTDPAKAISEAAIQRGQPLCLKALHMFTAIFGAVAGNLALTGLTTGGVYLGGGIPPRILPQLKSGVFMNAFVNKERFRGLLEKIAVRVVLNERTALLGAADYAFRRLMTTEE